ncbi:MAG: hypothetical protein FWG91_10180 [Lachnospiraceae bacterium]|nr:hypothetical protein [Lachnospiraceae bacterium]
MAVIGYYYNSVNGDRAYNGLDMNVNNAPFFKEGVSLGHLGVTADGSNMKIKVDGGPRTGYAFLNEKTIHNNTILELSVGQAHAVMTRVDRVIIRNDEAARRPSIIIVSGHYSQIPSPPPLTNDDVIQEKCLAEITVRPGAVRITQADIKDTRHDPELCGFIASKFNDVDFGFFAGQFNAWVGEFKTRHIDEIENWTAAQKEIICGVMDNFQTDFLTWFNGIRGQLSEDAAGNLFNNKVDIVVAADDIPINMRMPKTFYYVIKQKAVIFDEIVSVSPNMGLRIE